MTNISRITEIQQIDFNDISQDNAVALIREIRINEMPNALNYMILEEYLQLSRRIASSVLNNTGYRDLFLETKGIGYELNKASEYVYQHRSSGGHGTTGL